MSTIYYMCRWPAVAGGELVNWQHVASLHRHGKRAVALLDRGSQPIDPSRPPPVPVVRLDQSPSFDEADVVVLPEFYQAQLWQEFSKLPCRKVIHNQNPYYTFNGFQDMQALDDYGFVGAICCSDYTRARLQRWGSAMDWQVVHPHVLDIFAQSAATAQDRKRQIAYMPRKREVDAGLLRRIFYGMYPEWREVPWVEIRNLSRRGVAKLLAESEIFVSMSHLEGLGLPPLEAMSAGALVCGYTGGGGMEYATPENGAWVGEGNLEALAGAIADLLAADDSRRDRMRKAGSATATQFGFGRFETELLRAWQMILGG